MNVALLGLMNFDLDVPSSSEEMLMLDSYIMEFDITNVRPLFCNLACYIVHLRYEIYVVCLWM